MPKLGALDTVGDRGQRHTSRVNKPFEAVVNTRQRRGTRQQSSSRTNRRPTELGIRGSTTMHQAPRNRRTSRVAKGALEAPRAGSAIGQLEADWPDGSRRRGSFHIRTQASWWRLFWHLVGSGSRQLPIDTAHQTERGKKLAGGVSCGGVGLTVSRRLHRAMALGQTRLTLCCKFSLRRTVVGQQHHIASGRRE